MKIVLFILLVSAGISNAQRFDKKAFDKKYELKNDVVYVINGILYQPGDKTGVDSALGAYPVEHLVEVTQVKGMNGYKNREVVMVSFAYQQSEKQLVKSLETLKSRFSAATKNPVLWIDNENIPAHKTRQMIGNLKPTDIYFIDDRKDQVTMARYGPNGLVRVWTNKRAGKEPLMNEDD